MIEPIRVPAGAEYRELTPDEVQSVKHIFQATGNPLPDPATSTFVGAVDKGKVIGFIVLQVKLHAEPMWIEPGQSQVFPMLVKKAEETILKKCGPQWVYLFAPAGKVSQLAAHAGMQMEPWVVFSRLVMPETPKQPAVTLVTSEEMEQYPGVEFRDTGEAIQ